MSEPDDEHRAELLAEAGLKEDEDWCAAPVYPGAWRFSPSACAARIPFARPRNFETRFSGGCEACQGGPRGAFAP
jgi:hypothetical protein